MREGTTSWDQLQNRRRSPGLDPVLSLSDEWLEPKGLAISFAVPICAQEQDKVDPEMRQQIDAVQMKLVVG